MGRRKSEAFISVFLLLLTACATWQPATSDSEPVNHAVIDSPKSETADLEEDDKVYAYLKNMTYMVYFNEDAPEDPYNMKAAVVNANSYLAENAMEAVNLSQIEKLKRDQIRAYEEETGESMSLIQWIAQKLHADIYIEIDGRTAGETVKNRYYGDANVTLTVFEASTGRLLGSVPWNSPKQLSTTSETAARLKALEVSISKAMPKAIAQAQSFMEKELRKGIMYVLVIQNTPDARLMTLFRKGLEEKVTSVETVSQSDEETKYRLYFSGTAEELMDIVYEVAASITELESMEPVFFRGRSFTFHSGL